MEILIIVFWLLAGICFSYLAIVMDAEKLTVADIITYVIVSCMGILPWVMILIIYLLPNAKFRKYTVWKRK